jgi:hypothetical protein
MLFVRLQVKLMSSEDTEHKELSCTCTKHTIISVITYVRLQVKLISSDDTNQQQAVVVSSSTLSLFKLQVKLMSSEDTEHKELFRRNLSNTNLQALGDQAEAELHDDFSYEDHQQRTPLSPMSPRRVTGEIIRFHRVALDAPDGMPLVRGSGEWSVQYPVYTGRPMK